MTKKNLSERAKRSPRYLYTTYRTECEEAFPATFEFTDERTKYGLPVKPLYKPDIGVTIPVPMYYAGFVVSGQWLSNWNYRHRCSGRDTIAAAAVVQWRKMDKPAPLLTPRVHPWPTGDSVIYFVSHPADRKELKYLYDHRDTVLEAFLEVIDFSPEEKDIIRTKLFKWHRLMPTTISELDLDEPLPVDKCLQYTGPEPQFESDSEYESGSEYESDSG
ncbi:hypothetical protein CC2G_014495 [Coprinopsis cinerea AmutBmut pab1-1]|nr:hypothetical protein CC2G_014495 [Coprinopsis cinerea AmutBmut pab1-1]